MAHDIETVRGLLKSAAPRLRAHANVVATGVGYKVVGGKATRDLSLVCSVKTKLKADKLAAADLIPRTVDGVPTDVVQTGRIRALQARTTRQRPAPGGVSIGHRDITAGTLGCLVTRNGQRFILSNNHVLANSNDATAGDPILQPGPIDGGQLPRDQIATLEAFAPIRFLAAEPPSDCPTARTVIVVLNLICRAIGSRTRYQAIAMQAEDNLVDAAIARPLRDADLSDTILDIGAIQGVAEAALGTPLKKSGRTTALTTGAVQQIDVTVDVSYGSGRTARFTDQLLAGAMSQGGDSGSAVLDDRNRLVGLLFAGSETTTIINRIGHVFTALGVSR